MTIPLVSVILPTYNGSRFLAEAISSVLDQDYQNIELIVIDDASIDTKVPEIVRWFQSQDERVRYELNPRNMERSWSKNRWVELAKGEFIAFIDDDDVWQESKISEQMRIILQDDTIGVVGTWASFIDEHEKSIGETRHLKTSKEDIYNNILLSNQLIQSSVLIRKKVFSQVGWFPLFNLCEDYDCWLRVLQIAQGVNIPKSLIQYRVRATSTTTKNLYRMKWTTVKLVWKYRKSFPNAYRAIFLKLITFPFNISTLLRVWKCISQKASL